MISALDNSNQVFGFSEKKNIKIELTVFCLYWLIFFNADFDIWVTQWINKLSRYIMDWHRKLIIFPWNNNLRQKRKDEHLI
jgi:hypothetical protein